MRVFLNGALALLLIAVAAFSACDASSKLLSEAEKSSLYTVSLEVEGARLLSTSPSAVSAGAVVGVSLSRLGGATEPALLDIVLVDANSAPLAQASYGTPKARSLGSTTRSVPDLSGTLPSFSLPTPLAPGVYTLVATVRDAAGASLQESESVLLVAASGFGIASVSLYPTTSAPETPVLLQAQAEADASLSPDTWFRWSIAGRTIASGRLGDGAAKVSWTSPLKPGAYSIEVDLFPARPSEAVAALGSPWHQSVKAVVSEDAVLKGDEFADTSKLLTHLALAGDLADTGTRLQTDKPRILGTPSLEAYPGGFGYKLTEDERIALPGAVPVLGPGGVGFGASTFLFRLYASERNGVLYHLDNSAGSPVFRLGLAEGRPYAEVLGPGGWERSQATSAIGLGLVNLALSVAPVEGGLGLAWSANGERQSSPDLPQPPVDPTASSVLGGSGTLPGVYDEFAISDDAAGPPALYYAAMYRTWRSDLLIAAGFEPASLPPSLVPAGRVRSSPRRLALGPGASLAYSGTLPLGRPLALGLAYDASAAGPSLDFSDAEGLLFSVRASGEILGPDGGDLGRLEAPVAGRLSLIIRAGEKVIDLSAKDSLLTSRVVLTRSPQSLRLTIQNPSATTDCGLQRLLARVASEAVSRTGAPSLAALH